MNENKTPFIDALKEYIDEDVVPFDVPGHHMGNSYNPAREIFGQKVFKSDVNAPLGLDNLAKPSGVLYESEQLLAKACHADDAFFLINGTSSGIVAMIMTAVKAGEKIILPRNVHKSVVNALILSGAVPCYTMPEVDVELGIVNQPTMAKWKHEIIKNPSAKAIFIINPTYFGSVCDLKELVDFAHSHNMAVLVDEAHGAHYYFENNEHPLSAMEAGADLTAVSFHKTAGSLTQSSVLLSKGQRFSRAEIQTSLNIINTTSPSSILMASIEGARSYMESEQGKQNMLETYSLCRYARESINKIKGFKAPGKEHFEKHGSFDFDETKLVIWLESIDLNGFDLYKMLKTEYGIQMELAETNTVLAIVSIGTKKKHIDKLIQSLKKISRKYYTKKSRNSELDSGRFPFMLIRPRAAFHAPKKILPLEQCSGQISKEQIMIYPPGIPLIVPGEVWSDELVAKVKKYLQNGTKIYSSLDGGMFEVIDKDKWKRYSYYERKLNDYLTNKLTIPSDDGYSMPFEGEEHEATVVQMPFRRDTWREKAVPAQMAFKEVISAIAKFEKVIVLIHPSIYKRCSSIFADMENVETMPMKYNDSWARDNMPIFLKNGEQLRTVDFRFNAWGGEVDGLYSDWADDDKLGSIISKKLKLPCYRLDDFVLEGGSIAVDGDGTLITTEACLLSKGRNPTLSKVEIEERLKEYFGVKKVIWVPHGIYEDETNEHVDNMVAFIKPGEVVVANCTNKDDPQFKFSKATIAALEKETDAKGRKLIIHKMILPSEPLTITKEEADGLVVDSTTTDERHEGRRLAASYINFYQGKDFVIMPGFGVKEDQKAFKELSALFPNKKVVQINTREILLGGGNIHCITMQIPAKEKKQ